MIYDHILSCVIKGLLYCHFLDKIDVEFSAEVVYHLEVSWYVLDTIHKVPI